MRVRQVGLLKQSPDPGTSILHHIGEGILNPCARHSAKSRLILNRSAALPENRMTPLRAKSFTIDKLSNAYQYAAVQSENLDFYNTETWFRTLARHCLAEGEDTIVFVAGGLVLPMRTSQSHHGPISTVSANGLSNFYSCRFAPPGMSEGSDPHRAIEAIGLECRKRGYSSLRFDAMDEDTLAEFRRGLSSSGWMVEPFKQFGNWYLPTKGLVFSDYWDQRPGALRNTGSRRSRQLLNAMKGQVRCLNEPGDAPDAIASVQNTMAESWQKQEPFPSYLPELIYSGLQSRSLEVWVLTLNGAPIATQIWVERGDKATIFKLAYSKAWRKYSPGTVLTMAAMEHYLDAEKLEEIDFGWGDDAYKRDWLPMRRQRFGLAAYNPATIYGIGLAIRNLSPRYARRLLRR